MNLQYKHPSSIGDLYIVANGSAVTRLQWEDQGFPHLDKLQDMPLMEQTVKELDEYLKGERKDFTVPYDLTSIYSSDFARSVWSEVTKIGYNQTTTYESIATAINNPKAFRTVGSSVGKNPICIIVPCHRVIPKTNKLGGFSGGCGIKKKLLELEQNN